MVMVMVMVWSDPAVRWWQQKIARGCQPRHQALQQPWRCLKLDWIKWRVWSVWSVWSVRVNSSRLVPIWCKDHERAKLTIAHVVAWLLNQVDRTSSHLFFLEVPIDHICYTASALPGLLAFVSTDFNFFQSWLLPFWERRKGRQRGSCW